MTKHNPENERIKRRYLIYLEEAKGHSEQSLDVPAKALSRFEEYRGIGPLSRSTLNRPSPSSAIWRNKRGRGPGKS